MNSQSPIRGSRIFFIFIFFWGGGGGGGAGLPENNPDIFWYSTLIFYILQL